jgi:hypothetical protein
MTRLYFEAENLPLLKHYVRHDPAMYCLVMIQRKKAQHACKVYVWQWPYFIPGIGDRNL